MSILRAGLSFVLPLSYLVLSIDALDVLLASASVYTCPCAPTTAPASLTGPLLLSADSDGLDRFDPANSDGRPLMIWGTCNELAGCTLEPTFLIGQSVVGWDQSSPGIAPIRPSWFAPRSSWDCLLD